MCIDNRALNRVAIKSRYPIPRADELIDQLCTARFFWKIDLRGVFRPLLDKCVIVYLDDLLIYSPDKAQHIQEIEAVFKILIENCLLRKSSKCEFFQDRMELLGHSISADGVEIDPKRIATIQAWHAPTNSTELQGFLGFVNYVRRFVPDMAKLTAPLTDLLRKEVEYTWGEKEQAAFSALKKILCSPPVLHIADQHRPFELVTDASDIAVGAVLLQDFKNGLQPIAYESSRLPRPNATTRYTTARCWRSCTRSRCGDALSQERT
ncbi:unnamed protein product [Closterium sp. Yama58-4]|nr:unnamed protein product [Closterium sp. Yama58-4]